MAQNLFDPFGMWKDMYDKAEPNLSEAIHETIQKEEFAEWLGQLQSGFLQYQKMIQNTTDAYLKQSNIPTREEVSNIASLIINLEEKVDSLEEQLEDKTMSNQVSSEISKLKTSISKLDKKVDQAIKSSEDKKE